MAKLAVPVGPADHVQGKTNAEIVIVEYGDYECPSCGQAHPEVKRLQRHFGSRMEFVFRNFPLVQLHPWAEPAAEAAEFAGEHGKFWEMHDLLFERQGELGDALFAELAGQLGLSAEAVGSAVEQRANKARIKARVKADYAGGVQSGVHGTPTFYINGVRHHGPFDFEFLREAIERTIAG